MKQKTISLVKGKGSISHNNRDFIAQNVDEERIEWNTVFVSEPIEVAYEKCFKKALDDYNKKQTRADRKKDDYMSEIRHSKNGEKLFYENIVQIGDMHDTAVLDDEDYCSDDAEVAEEILKKYAETFQERNPHLYVFNCVLHMDEATPHLHIDYIPVATGYTRGMETRNSLSKALQQQGIPKAKNKKLNETKMWQDREREYLTKLAKERDIEIVLKGEEKRPYLHVEEYKEAMRKVDELQVEISDKESVLEEHKRLMPEVEKYLDDQRKEIETLEKDNEDLAKKNKSLEAKNKELTKKNTDLVEKNKSLGLNILSKEQVEKLPKPESTLTGDFYKVPKKRYENLLATAKETEVVIKDYNARLQKLDERCKVLDERERQIEESRKLPFKEKIEYVTLKKLKERVEKITEMIPDGKIKNMLLAVLRGEEIPTPMKQREKTKDRGIAI